MREGKRRNLTMIKKEIQEAFNQQINEEIYSSYLYLSMSAYFESVNLQGFAGWMRVQAQEELVHAMKFYSFIHERGGKVVLKALKAPETEWPSPQGAFEAALKHEQHITGRINDLVALAMKENDHASAIFLQWFVTEQVEEEASAGEVLRKVTMIGDSPGPMFMLDRELGQRTFKPPAGT
jgi:ferritin